MAEDGAQPQGEGLGVPVGRQLSADTPLGQQPVYFPVSVPKMIILSIASASLYQLYWAYRNWSHIKRADGVRIMPFWRAWFVLFFHYSLIKRIKEDASVLTKVSYQPLLLTISYLALGAAWQLPEPWCYMSLLDFLPLLPVVLAINAANEGRAAPELMNTRFTGWNYALLALGAAVAGVAILLRVRSDLLPS